MATIARKRLDETADGSTPTGGDAWARIALQPDDTVRCAFITGEGRVVEVD